MGFCVKTEAPPINGKEEMFSIANYITPSEDELQASIQTKKSDFVSA